LLGGWGRGIHIIRKYGIYIDIVANKAPNKAPKKQLKQS